MVPLLGFPAYHRQKIGIILVDSQKLLIVLDILRKMFLKEQVIEKPALNNGQE